MPVYKSFRITANFLKLYCVIINNSAIIPLRHWLVILTNILLTRGILLLQMDSYPICSNGIVSRQQVPLATFPHSSRAIHLFRSTVGLILSLIHISEPTRQAEISYAV